MNKFLLSIIVLIGATTFADNVVHPKTVAELKTTSVRIMNKEMNSGGTGSILKSFSNATHILTNKHICRLIEPGGVVDYKGQQYKITHYKKFPDHDLCLVRIEKNLNINLEVDQTLALNSSDTIVSGHPGLLPHIVTYGHMSEQNDVQLIVGMKECTKQDFQKQPDVCMFFGGAPVILTLRGQVTSNLIRPGNSGSAVFNKDGKIVGVVFAGEGRDFSFAEIVPQIYVIYFLQTQHDLQWIQVGTPVDDKGMTGRVFDYQKKCTDSFLKPGVPDTIRDFCKSINDNMVWRK